MAEPGKHRRGRLGGWPQPRALGAAGLLHAAAIVACLMPAWHALKKRTVERPVTVHLAYVPPPKPVKQPSVPPPPKAEHPSPASKSEPQMPSQPPAADHPMPAGPGSTANKARPPASKSEPQLPQQPPAGEHAEMRHGGTTTAQPPTAHEGPQFIPRQHTGNTTAELRHPGPHAGAANGRPATKPPSGRAASEGPPRQKPAQSTATAPLGAAVYGVTIEGSGAVDSIVLLQSSGRTDFDQAGEQMLRATVQFPPPQNSSEGKRFFTVMLRFTPEAH